MRKGEHLARQLGHLAGIQIAHESLDACFRHSSEHRVGLFGRILFVCGVDQEVRGVRAGQHRAVGQRHIAEHLNEALHHERVGEHNAIELGVFSDLRLVPDGPEIVGNTHGVGGIRDIARIVIQAHRALFPIDAVFVFRQIACGKVISGEFCGPLKITDFNLTVGDRHRADRTDETTARAHLPRCHRQNGICLLAFVPEPLGQVRNVFVHSRLHVIVGPVEHATAAVQRIRHNADARCGNSVEFLGVPLQRLRGGFQLRQCFDDRLCIDAAIPVDRLDVDALRDIGEFRCRVLRHVVHHVGHHAHNAHAAFDARQFLGERPQRPVRDVLRGTRLLLHVRDNPVKVVEPMLLDGVFDDGDRRFLMMLDEQRLRTDSTGEHHHDRRDGNEHPTPPTDTAVPRLVRRSVNSHRTLRRCCVAGFHLRMHLLPVLRLIIMRRHTARLSCLGCAAESTQAGACGRNPTSAHTEPPYLN